MGAEEGTAPGYTGVLSELEKQEIARMERCRAQHVGVYECLASLVMLKHLDLGCEAPPVVPVRSPQTLFCAFLPLMSCEGKRE